MPDFFAAPLCSTVREKLRTYEPETVHMPFHHRLLGKDRYAMFSFMQSMNTTFGISIWEQIAVVLGKGTGAYAEKQHKLLGEIDTKTEKLIGDMHYKLRKGEVIANKLDEVKQIRNTIKAGEAKNDPDSVVDLFIKIRDEENYFDITSAKPNMKEFVALKLKLMRWIALRLSQDQKAKVITRLAIPYNPYHPEPYERWTLKSLYDLDRNEIIVGEEFWNFVGGQGAYADLLDCFERAGIELRPEIDQYFSKFRTNNK